MQITFTMVKGKSKQFMDYKLETKRYKISVNDLEIDE